MKRLKAPVVVALGIGMGVATIAPAFADNSGFSTSCSTMTPGAVPVSLGVDNGSSGLALCYSTTPTGSSSPEATGGRITVFNPLATSSVGIQCEADRGASTVLALDCLNRVVHSDDPGHLGTSVFGTVQVGTVGMNVFRTGTENDAPVTTVNSPLDGDTETRVNVDNHTCAWVSGPGPCPLGITDATIVVREADVATARTTPASSPCVGVLGTCPIVLVEPGNDTNDTVRVTVAGTTHTADVPIAGPCLVNVNTSC
ncbi:MAG TPA: hypothetical protein VM938_09845 [Acidimicrobiales bacterium]|nr:hypothetical protein [Acidimicrobiales bacterium]